MPVYEITAEEMLGGGALVMFAHPGFFRARRRFVCPKCKQKSGVPISYGYPTDEMQEQVERREIVLGGCALEEGRPDRQCLDCGHKWLIVRRKV